MIFCFHERYSTAPSYFPSSVLVKTLCRDITFVVIKCTQCCNAEPVAYYNWSRPLMVRLVRSLHRSLSANSHTYYYLVFHHPPTHSFISGSKPSFSANPSHCSPSFFLLQDSLGLHGFPRLFTVISEHICFLRFVFLFLHFLVVGSVR